MPAHLPAARREEALYSVLARLGVYLGADAAGPYMAALLGRRHGIASPDLPGGLAALVGSSAESEAAIDRLIDRTTLFGFHTAFVPEELRQQVRHAMRGDMTGVYTRLGLATFRVRPPDRLRFCPTCLAEMVSSGLDPWWRRDHQMPGVLVCPEHGLPLRLSDVALDARNRHAFVPASREVWQPDAEPAVVASGGDLTLLHEVARMAAGLLASPPVGAAFEEINHAYRGRLADVGLMRSARKVDHSALRRAFLERWGGVTELIGGLSLGDEVEGSWLAALVRTGRRAAHPLQHLMLRGLLDSLNAVPRDLPFGAGPWPCRNPVADHHGRDVIVEVVVRRDGDVRYGDFACSCGYLYTRSLSTSGIVGEPRYRRFGPLFAPALRKAVADGRGLRAVARQLHLDPATLMREAAMAGVDVPWGMKPSGGTCLPVQPAAVAVPVRRLRSRRRARRNWFAIDVRLARSACQAADGLRADLPPVRVTTAAIEDRVARRNWIMKRRTKLPQTVSVIGTAVESTDAFRIRRMEWQVRKSLRGGDTRPCEILRAAGLPTGWLDAVRAEIRRAVLAARSAA